MSGRLGPVGLWRCQGRGSWRGCAGSTTPVGFLAGPVAIGDRVAVGHDRVHSRSGLQGDLVEVPPDHVGISGRIVRRGFLRSMVSRRRDVGRLLRTPAVGLPFASTPAPHRILGEPVNQPRRGRIRGHPPGCARSIVPHRAPGRPCPRSSGPRDGCPSLRPPQVGTRSLLKLMPR